MHKQVEEIYSQFVKFLWAALPTHWSVHVQSQSNEKLIVILKKDTTYIREFFDQANEPPELQDIMAIKLPYTYKRLRKEFMSGHLNRYAQWVADNNVNDLMAGRTPQKYNPKKYN